MSADLINQPVPQRLAPGKYAPVGKLRSVSRFHVAPVKHHIAKHPEHFIDQALGRGLYFRRDPLNWRRHRLQRPAFKRACRDTDHVEKLGDFRGLQDDPDRAGQCPLTGEYPVSGNRGHIGGGRGDTIHHRHYRLIPAKLADRPKKGFTADHGTARAVNSNDNGLNGVFFSKLFDNPEPLIVLNDDALDIDTRDEIAPDDGIAQTTRSRGDRRDHGHNRKRPPERQSLRSTR